MDNKPLNIVFIGRKTFPNGGAMTKRHRYYIDYLSTLENVKITNICTWQDNLGQNEDEGYYLGKVKYFNTSLPKKVKSFLTAALWAQKIIRVNFDRECDNVLITSTVISPEQILAVGVAKKMGYKIVSDMVENYDATGGDISFQLKVSHWFTRHVVQRYTDAFLVISTQIYKVYQHYGKPILLITNSAPIGDFAPKQIFHRPLNVVYTGTFASKDGIGYLVRGFDSFIKQYGDVAELTLIGKGKADEETESIINNNCFIKKMGYVPDYVLEATQKNADILCMTRCNSEFASYGFPFKLSEYLATGNTVLATAVGDVPLYIRNMENGLLVPPNSSQSIAAALEYAFTHQSECIKMGQEGIHTVQEHFSVEKNGEKLYRFIKEIFC